jgi:hypothetical protein
MHEWECVNVPVGLYGFESYAEEDAYANVIYEEEDRYGIV